MRSQVSITNTKQVSITTPSFVYISSYYGCYSGPLTTIAVMAMPRMAMSRMIAAAAHFGGSAVGLGVMAAGGGLAVERLKKDEHWQFLGASFDPVAPVLVFDTHKPEKDPNLWYMSNFADTPFMFDVKDVLGERAGKLLSPIHVEHSEKALMLTKATAMGDRDTISLLLVATTPRACKGLGRKVSPWDQPLWDTLVKRVAFGVLYQKFSTNEPLEERLLATSGLSLAEGDDPIWGIGLERSDPLVQDPSQWKGRNILGFALMQVRAALRHRNREAAFISGWSWCP